MPKARTAARGEARVRVRATCTGVVQGVGFRPAVYRHAQRFRLAGFVANSPEGAVIEVEGEEAAVRGFLASLSEALPPLARLSAVASEEIPVLGEDRFLVAASLEGRRRHALVPPDVAVCPDCRREMEDPRDRRYRYPFTTCTNCGPRFAVAIALPYDRSRTSMACFPLCPACQREYQDPADRRFHAEPVCCPVCGPTLRLLDARGGEMASGEDALPRARELLAQGRILAVKGLGGWQLACRADREAPVLRLRRRKRRPTKPLAIMARDLAVARQLAALGRAEEQLLASPEAPILLAPHRPRTPLARALAPGLADVGIMLPTTPLHLELFREAAYEALVMTSGNASDEPICHGNREALARLGSIADAFLLHDRDVVRRVDDSVARSGPGGPFLVRRSRGYVPTPLPLPEPPPEPILAVGGFLQTTVTVAAEGQAFPSQHVGDLDTELARAYLREVIANLEDFLSVTPQHLAADLHPDHPSRHLARRLAAERGGEVLELAHHLAHGAAVLGEHSRFPQRGEQVGILALDGTGFGPDGTAWGGELLLLSGDLAWQRLGFLQPLPLVGGERAVREPLRVAVAALAGAGGEALALQLPWKRRELVQTLVTLLRGAWPLASGAGRVFEAAAAVLGLGEVNRFEGELAMRLEATASRAAGAVAPWPDLAALVAPPVVRTDFLLAELARRRLARQPRAVLAAQFHASFAWLLAELATRVFPPGALVALGGGCLVNRLLRMRLSSELTERGFEALLPRRVPPGDGGLSYGQAVLAAVSHARGVRPDFRGGLPCA